MIDVIVLFYDVVIIICYLKKKLFIVYFEWMVMDGYELYEKEEIKILDICRLNKCY